MPNQPAQVTTGNASIRTGLQTGVSVSGLLYLLQVFSIVELSAEQVLAATPFLAAIGTFFWRVIENKLGKGLLREVAPKP